jgi:N-acetyl-D-muramate 6-phosphate phosphatase
MKPSLEPRAVRAVLFDLDGTLIDSAPDLGAAADKMRVDRGMPSLPAAQYRPMAGAGARGMVKVAFGLDPDHPEFETLKAEFLDNYEQAMTVHTRVFDAVPELIGELLQRGLQWGVVTNKAMRFTAPLTAAMPLFASASSIVGGDSTPHAKPHPEPLLMAARQIGVSPDQCLYVGDDERDMVAGRSAGMITVAAQYGYLGQKINVKEWPADAHIEAPLDLLRLVWLDKKFHH